MSGLTQKIILAAAMLLGGVLPAADYEFNVQMETGADADIRLTVPGGQMPQSGFLPLRVRINNRNKSERRWELELGSTGMGGYQTGAEFNFASTFDVPAASTREFFLFAPVLAGSDHRPTSIRASLTGPQVERSEVNLGLGYYGGMPYGPLAVEPGLETKLNDILFPQPSTSPAVPGRPVFRRPGPTVQNISVIDPALWPADWRLWSPFTTVLLEHATWERLDSARRRALLDWVALGGRLVRLNSPTTAYESLGAGLNYTITAAMLSATLNKGELLLRYSGQQGIPGGNLVNAGFWEMSVRDWQLGGPRRWLTGYIIGFGLLIGPVNLFYFAPAGRRHRLFFTVPVISLAAAVLLFGIITFSDGIGGAGTRRALVVLQPAQNQAVVFQRQISRTGLLTGRKFALPADSIMNQEGDERAGAGVSQQLWRDGDVASGDWFTSRSMQQHSLRRLVPTRERVELVGLAGSAPVVQSTVGGTLRDFLFTDPAGNLWTAAEVPPGTRVTLVAMLGQPTPGLTDILKFTTPHQKLPRGTFFALGGAGLIPTLPSIRWRDDVVLYTGPLISTPEAAP